MSGLGHRLIGGTLLIAVSGGAPVATIERQGSRQISTAAFKADVDAFFDREVASHLAQIPEEGALPDRVHGALTTGDFSWGTFVRALAAYAETRGTRRVAGRDIVPLVARVGVSESAKGSKAFAQLYAALALRHFGADLSKNPLWQTLAPAEQAAWRSLLDPTRFYDPGTRKVIDLPENYLGVASRIATLSQQMGVLTDRAFVDALLDRAAEPFTRGAIFADDAGTTGRYDRYSHEYARYVYEAAETAGRADLLTALTPSLETQMRLWWDLVSPDGYGYPWGRSLGVVSYLDTLEIVAFAARHPQFRPAPLPDLASEYRLAWGWLQRDYKPDRHMLSVFDPGRGNYAYISKDREWQQTVGFFGKAIMAHDTLMRVLSTERVTAIPASPALPPVTRFEYFRRGDRPAGVWLVRLQDLRFTLPITTGTKPGVADYLPAPHGLPGFAAPVEQVFPAATTFFSLPDGSTVVATDGADEVHPAPDGRSVRAVWRRLAVVGTKSGELRDTGFDVAVDWRIEGRALVRTETILPRRAMTLAGMRWAWPSTATRHESAGSSGVRLIGSEGTLTVTPSGGVRWTAETRGVPDRPEGRGARGAIPTQVLLSAGETSLQPGTAITWSARLELDNASSHR